MRGCSLPLTPKAIHSRVPHDNLFLLINWLGNFANSGLKEVRRDEFGYVTATMPSNLGHPAPVVGFISHVDTSPDYSGENVNPQQVQNYQGQDLILNDKEQIVLSPSDFPELMKYVGQDIITTDGENPVGCR